MHTRINLKLLVLTESSVTAAFRIKCKVVAMSVSMCSPLRQHKINLNYSVFVDKPNLVNSSLAEHFFLTAVLC